LQLGFLEQQRKNSTGVDPQCYALGQRTHAAINFHYGQTFTQMQSTLQSYYRKSSPMIASLSYNEYQNLQLKLRELLVWEYFYYFRHSLGIWYLVITECCAGGNAPPPPATPPKELQTPGTAKAPPSSAHKHWKFSGGLGPLSAEIDDGGFTIQGGEGIFGGLTERFQGPSGRPETTVFVGVGASASAGPLSASAAATVSMTQMGGQVVDVSAGVSSTASGSVPVIGNITGEMDISYGSRAGGNCTATASGSLIGAGSWSAGGSL